MGLNNGKAKLGTVVRVRCAVRPQRRRAGTAPQFSALNRANPRRQRDRDGCVGSRKGLGGGVQ